MAYFKEAAAMLVVLTMAVSALARPQVQANAAANNAYLPPDSGYIYDAPSNDANILLDPPKPARTTPALPPPAAEEHDHVHEPGMPFEFRYDVADAPSGNDFSENAVSDGDVVKGEYRVALPDGRVQLVRYTADWKNGYNAEVTYEGTAVYPEDAKKN